MEQLKLVNREGRIYDETTGNYSGGERTETIVYADVNTVSVENVRIMYGDMRKRAIVVRNPYPLNWYTWNFDYVIFRGKKYTLDNDNAYGLGVTSFYFSEV